MNDDDTDYMAGLECPQCGQSTELLVQSTNLIRLTNNDLEIMDGKFNLFDSAPAQCPACNYEAPFHMFQLDREFTEFIHVADMEASPTRH